MATADVLNREEGLFLSSRIHESRKGESVKSRGMSIEKKIEILESLAGTVSNRRSRRWLNDRLLMELVPRLNAEEIRGLFAPPPFGDDVPLSPFCMANVPEWDTFRNIDMDKQANIIDSLESPCAIKKGNVDADKMAVLNAWRRVDSRTREALRRSVVSELIEGYEQAPLWLSPSFFSLVSHSSVTTLLCSAVTQVPTASSQQPWCPRQSLSLSLQFPLDTHPALPLVHRMNSHHSVTHHPEERVAEERKTK